MPDTTFPMDRDETAVPNPSQHFAAAVEQAKAGAAALGRQAQDQADGYRGKLAEQTAVWTDQAKERGDEALGRIKGLAIEGKAGASGAIDSAGKFVEDNAALVDDKLGVAYGDHVRTLGRSLREFAGRLDEKEVDELTADLQAFVRERPGVAIGIAAASGFFLSRLFAGSRD